MGNAALRDLASLETVSFDDLRGSVVAVDAHNWLYRYLTTTVRWTNDEIYTTADGTELANLVGIVQGLPKFFENDLTPVFVFDGGPSELKTDEIEKRRANREQYEDQLEEARERGDDVAVATLESRTQRLTDTIIETSKELLNLFDVPVIQAPAEGEAQGAHMARQGDVNYVGTEDYDALLFGAPRTLRKLTSKGDPELMNLEGTLEEHGLTWEQLVDVALLCGTDFNDGVDGIGPKTALKLVREHGDLWGALEAEDAYVENGDLVRTLFLDPNVTDDYGFDEEITPEMDAAREYVVDEWAVDADEVERGFERIDQSVVQSGLGRWS
ncbi:MAG: flap endonuclease-1 [Halobacteriales archaeon]|jgi:flap endonuclease-1